MGLIYVEDDADDGFMFQSVWKSREGAAPLTIERSAFELRDRITAAGTLGDLVERPALILLDLNLPVMDGFEFLHWLRQQPYGWDVPVVVFSSSSSPTDIRRAYALGANGYAVKPNTLDGLAAFAEALRRYWFEVNRISP
jgi:CheY-like chemotaxis protein